MRAALLALCGALAGCSSLPPPTPLPAFCRVQAGGFRAPLTPEQQQVCTYGNRTVGEMFHPLMWGQPTNLAPIPVIGSRTR